MDFYAMLHKAGNPMNFDDHNYVPIVRSLNLEYLKILHSFNDVNFVKKVKSGLINSNLMESFFEARKISYSVGAAREFDVLNSPRNYFRFSTVPRLKTEWNKWNKIVPMLNVNNASILSSLKKFSEETIFKYE